MNITDFLPYIAGSLTSIPSYFVGRSRSAKETEGVEIENLKKIIDIQQDTINFMKGQIENLQTQVNELQSVIKTTIKTSKNGRN